MAKSKKEDAAKTAAAAPAQPEVKTEEKKVALTKLRGPRGVPETAKITLLTANGANPKREGSNAHKAFACYRDGMTVGEFCDAVNASGQEGMGTPNLVYDASHGFIKIEGYNPEVTPVKPKAEKKPAAEKKPKKGKAEAAAAETPKADAEAAEEVID